MADFNQAIKWLKEGKKVRRKSWDGSELEKTGLFLVNRSGICYKRNSSTEYFNLSISDFEATDWEIYCKEHEWIGKNIDYPEYCSRCGIDKPKEELKTLKDLYFPKHINESLKQEAIKDIKLFRKDRSSNPEYSKQELNGVEKYIMWKFNIIEEDLK